MRWPEPRNVAAAPEEALSRRHYLRVTVEAHPGIERRIDSLVRRCGLSVQSRANRVEGDVAHHGFLISESTDARFQEARAAVATLSRVVATLGLGVVE